MGQDLISIFVSEFTDSASPFDNPASSPLEFARVQYLAYIGKEVLAQRLFATFSQLLARVLSVQSPNDGNRDRFRSRSNPELRVLRPMLLCRFP